MSFTSPHRHSSAAASIKPRISPHGCSRTFPPSLIACSLSSPKRKETSLLQRAEFNNAVAAGKTPEAYIDLGHFYQRHHQPDKMLTALQAAVARRPPQRPRPGRCCQHPHRRPPLSRTSRDPPPHLPGLLRQNRRRSRLQGPPPTGRTSRARRRPRRSTSRIRHRTRPRIELCTCPQSDTGLMKKKRYHGLWSISRNPQDI